MSTPITSRLREGTTIQTADLDGATGLTDEIVTLFSSLTKDHFSPQAAIPNGLKSNPRSRWEPAIHNQRMEQSGTTETTAREGWIVLPFDAYLESVIAVGRAQSIGNVGDSLLITVTRWTSLGIDEALGTYTFDATNVVTTERTLFSAGRWMLKGEQIGVRSLFTTGGVNTTWFECLSITPRFRPLHARPPSGSSGVGGGQ